MYSCFTFERIHHIIKTADADGHDSIALRAYCTAGWLIEKAHADKVIKVVSSTDPQLCPHCLMVANTKIEIKEYDLKDIFPPARKRRRFNYGNND